MNDRKDINNVTQVEYYIDDIRAYDDHIVKNEQLYDELHSFMDKLKGNSVNFGGVKDIAEMGRTLAGIRTSGIEGVNKRFQAKRSLADMELKKEQLKNDDALNQNNAEVARNYLTLIRQTPKVIKPVVVDSPQGEIDLSELNNRVSKELDNGSIAMSKNDKAMKYSLQKVTPVYSKEREKLIALDKDGKEIPDYPEIRMVKGKIIRKTDDFVVTDKNERIKVVD